MTKKTKQETVVPVAAPVPTEASKLWSEISVKSINVFALPVEQVVENYFKPDVNMTAVDSTKLYLQTINPRATAAITALEVAVGKNYVVEVSEKYIVVKRA